MALCTSCGRPAGFGQHLCPLCASGGPAARAAAEQPFVLLTVRGSEGGGRYTAQNLVELRVTSQGLEAANRPVDDLNADLGLAIRFQGPSWSIPYANIERVDWDVGLVGATVTVYSRDGGSEQVWGLNGDQVPAARELLERKLAEARGAAPSA